MFYDFDGVVPLWCIPAPFNLLPFFGAVGLELRVRSGWVIGIRKEGFSELVTPVWLFGLFGLLVFGGSFDT